MCGRKYAIFWPEYLAGVLNYASSPPMSFPRTSDAQAYHSQGRDLGPIRLRLLRQVGPLAHAVVDRPLGRAEYRIARRSAGRRRSHMAGERRPNPLA